MQALNEQEIQMVQLQNRVAELEEQIAKQTAYIEMHLTEENLKQIVELLEKKDKQIANQLDLIRQLKGE